MRARFDLGMVVGQVWMMQLRMLCLAGQESRVNVWEMRQVLSSMLMLELYRCGIQIS